MYNINTINRIAAFLAQTGHESLDFTVVVENLNYSTQGLRKTFKKYFPTDALAKQYARQPEKIANRVYANRMGNGSEASGDGWKYRGKGLIQLTGKSNHAEFAQFKNLELSHIVDYLLTPEGAFESACWFWSKRGLNPIADAGDVTRVTKLINGGTNGLRDRQVRYTRAKNALVQTPVAESATVLRVGSKGQLVQKLQTALGVTSDGDFGKNTEEALKTWQRNNGLVADGIAGPVTQEKLFG
jgi:putative chitinase